MWSIKLTMKVCHLTCVGTTTGYQGDNERQLVEAHDLQQEHVYTKHECMRSWNELKDDKRCADLPMAGTEKQLKWEG